MTYKAIPEHPEQTWTSRTLQGRCKPCRAAYRWVPGHGLPRRLKGAGCPKCGKQLNQTMYTLKSVPWYGLAPK